MNTALELTIYRRQPLRFPPAAIASLRHRIRDAVATCAAIQPEHRPVMEATLAVAKNESLGLPAAELRRLASEGLRLLSHDDEFNALFHRLRSAL